MKTINLTKGKVAQVSDEDYDRVACLSWHALQGKTTWYAVHGRRVGKKMQSIYLHKFILGIGDGQEGDHRDRDGLNNQRENLRVCTTTQNQYNRRKYKTGLTSRHKGVSIERRSGKWKLQINVHGKQVYVGLFPTEDEAGRCYNRLTKALYGDFVLENQV